ncbi:hypothetical protein BYT27DRAFT_7248242 [Phlegmacium glaucopus]|nr:hypothetical protein BYT27DRAFT_7260662 [Phlegmacium glaucopus]KAF8816532.1 hypothetical protein BYT27DRAFT_7248242 [Phlegmacium glaucopus]
MSTNTYANDSSNTNDANDNTNDADDFISDQVEALDRHYYYPSTSVSTLAINDLHRRRSGYL